MRIGPVLPRPALALLVAMALGPACDRATPSPPPSSSSSSPSAAPPQSGAAPPRDTAPAGSAPRLDNAPDASAVACTKRAGPTRLLWNDDSYQLVLDGEALACLSDAERAAVAFVGTTLGTECDWVSGTDLAAPEHMECKLTTALGLGYQCEAKHKEFLVKWLGDDIPAQCARIPTTAFAQTALTELSLTHEGQTITVMYKATTTTGPGGEAWSWSETIRFQEKSPGTLKVVARKPVGKRK